MAHLLPSGDSGIGSHLNLIGEAILLYLCMKLIAERMRHD